MLFIVVAMDKFGTVEIESANDAAAAQARCDEVKRLAPDARVNWYSAQPGARNERLHLPGK